MEDNDTIFFQSEHNNFVETGEPNGLTQFPKIVENTLATAKFNIQAVYKQKFLV
jgi:hypothetical protein